jgi:hypothetical protein
MSRSAAISSAAASGGAETARSGKRFSVTLDRVIAVKRLRDDPDTGQDTPITKKTVGPARILFPAEALTTAHLEHPNIVPVV